MSSTEQGSSRESPITPSKIGAHLAKFAYAAAATSPSPVPRSSTRTPVKRELRIHSPESPRILPSPAKKAKYTKKPRPYAGPEVYKHLRPVNDHLGLDLDVVFCGINPGKQSAVQGHHYANPTNRFWKCLHGAGFTDRLVSPSEDFILPETYNLGLTNLVDRPTSEQSELSTLEMRQSVAALLGKLDKHRPRVLCFVGKKIWDAFESVISKAAQKQSVGLDGGALKDEKFSPKRPSAAPRTPNKKTVKILELDVLGEIKVERDPPPTKSPRTPRKGTAPWAWDHPRPYKYVYNYGNACYFWVVPSTSGLERSLIGEKIEHFKAVRLFAQQLQMSQVDTSAFSNFSMDGVADAIKTFETAAAGRAAKLAARIKDED